MSNLPSPPAAPASLNPADIAREAFRRLATRRIAPTPDAYRAIYDEIAGIPPAPPAPAPDSGAAEVLAGFARRLADTPGEVSEYGRRMLRAVKAGEWNAATQALGQVFERHLRRNTPITSIGAEEPDTRRLREMLARTLSFAVASLLNGSPDLVKEAESLALTVRGQV